jgi:hypothetical protein
MQRHHLALARVMDRHRRNGSRIEADVLDRGEGVMKAKAHAAMVPPLPAHVGETLLVHRPATDETGEQIAGGSVTRFTRREATDETGETIAGGSAGTEDWQPPGSAVQKP